MSFSIVFIVKAVIYIIRKGDKNMREKVYQTGKKVLLGACMMLLVLLVTCSVKLMICYEGISTCK